MEASLTASADTRNHVVSAWPKLETGWGIFLFLWLVYSVLPTQNHYWDGIGFALNIEGVAQDSVGFALGQTHSGGSGIYFNPNHLLHNWFGYWVYQAVCVVNPAARALHVLVAVNSLLSAVIALLVFRMMVRWGLDARASLWLSLLLGFSGTWWKFSTDANAYIPSAFFLVAASAAWTLPRRRPTVAGVGFLLAGAILIHQIAVLFYPALLVAIWTDQRWPDRTSKVKAALVYTLASAGPTLVVYLIVWNGVLAMEWSPAGFLHWLTFNGGDVYSTRTVEANLGVSLMSLARVALGGRLSLAWRVVPPGMLLVMLGMMAWALRKLWMDRRIDGYVAPKEALGIPLPFLVAWAGSFLVFLLFWLTEYPYYRLFCYPALILAAAAVVHRRPKWGAQLPAIVVLVAAFNFTFMIYPYSRAEATPPVHVAQQAQAVLPAGAIVLYRQATCDNWMMRYFNPQTRWVETDSFNGGRMSTEVRQAFDSGKGVWMDTTFLEHLRTQNHGVRATVWGISNREYHIQFAELVPHMTLGE